MYTRSTELQLTPMPVPPPVLPRRGFLTRLGLALLGTVAATRSSAQQGTAWRDGPPQDAWLARLTGTHRQLFDTPALKGGGALSQVRNFLDAYRDAYGVGDADLNAVVGVHGGAIPLVFDDRTWERFGFGESYDVLDAETRAPARRNVFRAGGMGGPLPAEATVEALQRRGVIFLLCNNSLRRATGTLSAAGHGTPGAVREALLAGLLPGVEVVPAMVVAINLAQEKEVTYVYAG